ncbi:hypothetical protein DNTS_013226 [Danionella cerebrum]|uniref:mRNA m(6)A methyltransferase n=1 Tax=Danionella cerebrum TaxID=2873325 RepID=A0A553Q5T1_9TELE|nr:hypothetical protein DNTS_013226 [Danionella translucida]
MSDTWSHIQAHKKQLDSLRERLQRRRKDPAQLGVEVGASEGGAARSDSPGPTLQTPPQVEVEHPPDPELEKRLLGYLSELSLSLPTDSLAITNQLNTSESPVSHASIQSLLLKFSAQELIEVRQSPITSSSCSSSCSTFVTSVDHTKLWAMIGGSAQTQKTAIKRKADDIVQQKRPAGSSPLLQAPSSPPRKSSISLAPASNSQLTGSSGVGTGVSEKKGRSNKVQASHLDMEIESLLSQQSTKEQQSKKVSREILELLNTSSAKEQSIVEKFRSRGRAQVQEFCDHGTKEECMQRIINKHTDESLGDCSFLNTCFHMDTCKYVHYEIDSPPEAEGDTLEPQAGSTELGLHSTVGDSNVGKLFPSQWICCDIRYLDMSILGKFAVVMADPPWDIHMELPYGTLTDDEMRKLNIPILQDDGFLFLWMTGSQSKLAPARIITH